MYNDEFGSGFPSERAVVEKLKTALGLVETLKQENHVYKDNFDQVFPNFLLIPTVERKL
jgi:hypothetical protein